MISVENSVEPSIAHPRPEHLPALDGLRGFAALLVVIGHGPMFGLLSPFPRLIQDYGVLLFFSLSGFLMGHLYLSRPFGYDAAVSYIAARIARIVPLYFLVVLASFAIFRFGDPLWVYPVGSVQLLHLLTFHGSVSVFWSIGPEFQFYFLFVPIWMVLSRSGNPLLSGVAIAAPVIALTLLLDFLPGILIFSKLHIFIVGIYAAVLRRHILAREIDWQVLALVQGLALLMLVALMIDAPFARSVTTPAPTPGDLRNSLFYGSMTRALLAGYIVFACSLSTRGLRLLFATPLARMLGACSFSLYLLHDPVFTLLERGGVTTRLGPALATPLAIALAVGVAWISYRLIERPARDGMRWRIILLAAAAKHRQPR